eukprot:Opistho-1_new@52692
MPFEEIVGKLLQGKSATLSLAESCTGGYISHLITQVSGASNYYKGGVVSYLVEVKENVLGVNESDILDNGAVSESVAIQMAEGVRRTLKSDYSLSITGILDKKNCRGRKRRTRYYMDGSCGTG